MNCHYVTQSFTRPWEDQNRTLVYFDFSAGRVCRSPSRDLFAKEDIFSRAHEDFFNKYFEAPLDAVRSKLSKGTTDLNDWREFRALFLYFIIQAPRFTDSNKVLETGGGTLKTLLEKGEVFLDDVVRAMQIRFSPAFVKMPRGHILFFPETGFFQFPVNETGPLSAFDYAYAVPLAPTVAISMTPLKTDARRLSENLAYLQTYSVGINSIQNRILIPPQVLQSNTEEKIAEVIRSHRSHAASMLTALKEVQDLAREMYASVGLRWPA